MLCADWNMLGLRAGSVCWLWGKLHHGCCWISWGNSHNQTTRKGVIVVPGFPMEPAFPQNQGGCHKADSALETWSLHSLQLSGGGSRWVEGRSAEWVGDVNVLCCASAWWPPACFCHSGMKGCAFSLDSTCARRNPEHSPPPLFLVLLTDIIPLFNSPAAAVLQPLVLQKLVPGHDCPYLTLFLPFTASHEGGAITWCDPAHRDFHSGHTRLNRSVCRQWQMGAVERLLVCTCSH